MYMNRILTAALLGGVLLIGGGVPAQARDRDDRCEQRIRKDEVNLNKAVRKHGERSRQAEKRRQELERDRATCRLDNRDRR